MTNEVAAATEAAEPGIDEAFAAGYNEAFDDKVDTPAPEPEAQAKGAPPPEPERNEYGFTTEEMKSILSRYSKVDDLEQQLESRTQQIHGKLGEAFRTLQSMQTARSAQGFNVKLTEDDLDEELRTQFPELGAMQLRTLQKVLGKALGGMAQAAPAAPAVDPEEIKRQVREDLNKQYEGKFLTVRHPDWRQAVKSEDWNAWVGLQPPRLREQIETSLDADFLAEQITSFKTWKNSADSARSKKETRLETAVAPRGVASAPKAGLDEAAAFLAGYNKVRGLT